MATWLDHIIFWRSRPIRSVNIGDRISVIETNNANKPVALKFKYSGNTQYHQLSHGEADALITELISIRNKGSK